MAPAQTGWFWAGWLQQGEHDIVGADTQVRRPLYGSSTRADYPRVGGGKGMLLALIGAVLLAGMTITLFGLSLFETAGQHGLHLLTLVGAVTLAAVVAEKWKEFDTQFLQDTTRIEWSANDAGIFLGVVGGAFLTFALSNNVGLGPVVAAGLVGILATLAVRRFDVPIYCGAFVGMACSTLLHSYGHLGLAAVIAGAVFLLTKPVFNGFGGKLGTIALLGCIGSSLLTGRTLGSAPVPGWDVGGYLVAYSVLGAVLTYILNVRLKHSPVISSGLVGLAGGLLLPVLHPGIGQTLGVMVICASFAGMSNRLRVPNELYLAIGGVLCALVFMYSSPYLGGAGGKLGTIAFGSVIAVAGARRVGLGSWGWLANRRSLSTATTVGERQEP